ncbi:MAG TPA: right-handed parallel beta-helix repeat-containing protein [Vicinamibacterales bacterium]|nr:right-handed parallel beta-helix repeat-containing protein [Vicinamibacterales bacterium]
MRVTLIAFSVIVLVACDSRPPLPGGPSSVPDALRPAAPAAPTDTASGQPNTGPHGSHDVGAVVACGATIVSNTRLGHDLACPAGGLVIGADGITLDLNGHTISGADTGNGITIIGRRHVSVVGGTVRNFAAGMLVMNSTGVLIKHDTLLENTDGVDCQAGCAENTIKESEFRDNRARGVMLRSGSIRNEVKENTFAGNRVGVLLFGAVDTVVKENMISDSGLAGIRINVLATGNLVKENRASSNPAGIEFLVTPTGSARGNSVVENTLAANACGLKGPTSGNTIRENKFQGNGADSCA